VRRGGGLKTEKMKRQKRRWRGRGFSWSSTATQKRVLFSLFSEVRYFLSEVLSVVRTDRGSVHLYQVIGDDTSGRRSGGWTRKNGGGLKKLEGKAEGVELRRDLGGVRGSQSYKKKDVEEDPGSI